MTKYLNPQPFSGPVSHGHLTDRQYALAVGAIVFCPLCGEDVPAPHECPEDRDEAASRGGRS